MLVNKSGRNFAMEMSHADSKGKREKKNSPDRRLVGL